MMMPIGPPASGDARHVLNPRVKELMVLPRCPRLSSARLQQVPGLGDARLGPFRPVGTAALNGRVEAQQTGAATVGCGRSGRGAPERERGKTMGKRGYAAALLTSIALLCIPAPASAAPAISTIALRDAVTVEGVRAHQEQFQDFADKSDGTREASTLGYELSADY